MSRSERLVASAFCYASVIVFACAHACVFSYFFAFLADFCSLWTSVVCQWRLGWMLLVCGWRRGLVWFGEGGDVSRALNQTKETRIDRCGFTGLTPISLSADYWSLIAFGLASAVKHAQGSCEDMSYASMRGRVCTLRLWAVYISARAPSDALIC